LRHYMDLVAILLALGLASALSSDGKSAPGSSPAAQESAEQVVEYLVNLAHGPERTTERGRQLLAHLREHPAKYVEAVRRRLALPEPLSALYDPTDASAMRLGSALHLARSLGSKHGGPLLREFLDNSAKRLEQATREPKREPGRPEAAHSRAVRRLELNQRTALKGLSSFEDPSAVEWVFQRINTKDRGEELVMMDYLLVIGRRDERVVPRLRQMLNNPHSALYDDPLARERLDWFDRQSDPKSSPR
jgi:hypothetical protein